MTFVPAPFKLSLIAVALGLTLGAPAYGQSLQEAVEQTLQTNPDVLIDASKRLSTDEAVKGARGGYLPKVDLLLGTGRERSNNSSTGGTDLTLTRREASLTLTQMLFDGFGVSSEVDRNQARVESAAHKLAGTSEQVGLQAIEAYLEVLRQRELVELTRANLGAHDRTLDQVKIRAESGVGRKADFEQIQARSGLAKANFTAAETNLRDAETNFLRVVGVTPVDLSKPNQPEPGALPKSMEEAVQLAFDNNPVLKSAMADVAAAEAQNRAAKSFMYPRFDLELGAAENENLDGVVGDNDERYAMLRMRYNLFKGGSDKARVDETAQLTNEAREIARRTRQQLEQSTRLSWNAMVSAGERLPSLKQHADASLATRDAYTKQFSIGQRTLLDMLDSENEHFTASSNYVTGQYVELFAHYRVLADMGQLLGVLGVSPRAETMVEARQ
ncbi:MAG: TolC family outer membrane protein [Gammaproteobacteria bacterium]|nr:TolC family outer membrane protein [Gammaproteobacteria bacterium]